MKTLYMLFSFLILIGCGSRNGTPPPESIDYEYINIKKIVEDVEAGGRIYAG